MAHKPLQNVLKEQKIPKFFQIFSVSCYSMHRQYDNRQTSTLVSVINFKNKQEYIKEITN